MNLGWCDYAELANQQDRAQPALAGCFCGKRTCAAVVRRRMC